MKLALAQTTVKIDDKKANIKQCYLYIKEAAENNADIIVFPEMTITGFSMRPEITGEELEGSETISFFKKEAKKNSIAICFGMPILVGKRAKNAAVVLDKKGCIIGIYYKIHPFSLGWEAKHYIGGDEIVKCTIEGIKVSPFICYDLRFPEIYQAASKESELLITISNWPKTRSAAIKPLVIARALENQSYSAFVNITGYDGKLVYSGNSIVSDPYGNIILEAGEKKGVYYCDIEHDLVAKYREEFPLKLDRKNELYIKLLSGKQLI